MEDIVDRIKQTVLIEDVISQEYRLDAKRGRYRKATEHDSLVVDVGQQCYFWNSRGETGDVIDWVMRRRGVDFKTAVEELARAANLPAPEWHTSDNAHRLAARAREDAWDVACRLMEGWLWADDQALAYARTRGWSDETIKAARLGFTGRMDQRPAMTKQIREALKAQSIELDTPAVVAIIGYSGDVGAWGRKHEVVPQDDWIAGGAIHGLLGRDMLVYPHLRYGKVAYFSARGIAQKRHYNLPVELAGQRQVYLNARWPMDSETVVIVEGQADAVSLGQWELPAVAMAGCKVAPDQLKALIKDRSAVYLGLDADQAGQLAGWQLARDLGPMVRMLDWSTAAESWDDGGEQRPVKDANDLLRALATADEAVRNKTINTLINESRNYAEAISAWAGSLQGAAHDTAMRQALEVISQMGEYDLQYYRTKLTKALGIGVRELNNMIKEIKAIRDEEEDDTEPIFTFGGYIEDHIVEYLYNPETDEASLAWRDPAGVVRSGKQLQIGNKRYLPEPATPAIKLNAVRMPTALGEKKTLRELIAYIELYLRSAYLFPTDKMVRLIAYYVMGTWIYDCFKELMYLRVLGGAGAGKSEFLKRVGLVCYRLTIANGAGSTPAFFRISERYRGTVFIDEADLPYSDTENDMVKFYNLGAMQDGYIWRMHETMETGVKAMVEQPFRTFCPKMIAMRKEFKDDAVGSRSLTFKLQSREMQELKAHQIPLSITKKMEEKAIALRNLLVRWRLETWQPSIELDLSIYDDEINTRLNQVAGPLMALSADDPEQQEEIKRNLREYYKETILSASMTINARVIEALWKIWLMPDLRQEMVIREGEDYLIKTGDVTKVTNSIIDEMNDDDVDADSAKRTNERRLTSRKVGAILRETFQFRITDRRRNGFFVYWNEPKLKGLSVKHGVEPADFGPQEAGDSPLEKIAQGKLI